MVVTDRQGLLDALRDEARGGLRVVATYDEDGYDVFYVREDAEPRVDARADDVHDELVLQDLGRGHLEDLFGAGDLQCSMHRFEVVTAFHFTVGEFEGLLVSVDSDTDVPLATFARTCEGFLERSVSTD